MKLYAFAKRTHSEESNSCVNETSVVETRSTQTAYQELETLEDQLKRSLTVDLGMDLSTSVN